MRGTKATNSLDATKLSGYSVWPQFYDLEKPLHQEISEEFNDYSLFIMFRPFLHRLIDLIVE